MKSWRRSWPRRTPPSPRGEAGDAEGRWRQGIRARHRRRAALALVAPETPAWRLPTARAALAVGAAPVRARGCALASPRTPAVHTARTCAASPPPPRAARDVRQACCRAGLLMEIWTGWLMGISQDERAWSRLTDGAIIRRARGEDTSEMALSRGESSQRRRATGGPPVSGEWGSSSRRTGHVADSTKRAEGPFLVHMAVPPPRGEMTWPPSGRAELSGSPVSVLLRVW